MEALLRVQAETTTSVWKPDLIELAALHVDDFSWSPYDSQWRRSAAPCIQLHVDGHPRGTGVIYINGRKTTFSRGSQKNRLAVGALTRILKNPQGYVTLNALGADKTIWEGRKLPCVTVRQRLNSINPQLEGLLELGDQVRVNAKIELIDKPLGRKAASSV